MKKKLQFYINRIKSGRLQEMYLQIKWIYQYAKHYWKPMVFYTLIGMFGTIIGLLVSMVSKELVDIITGHETGRVLYTFITMIILTLITSFVGQISSYISGLISMRVDAEIKSDIFNKILITDWESLTTYHTGDLLARWGSDASSISSGVLNFVPNAILNVFRFATALAVMIYYDWTFAVFAFLGVPVSMLLSKTLMRRMVNNNQRSAAMSAKMSGFNQEAFSNIQTIKAFDLIGLYVNRLKNIQKEYIYCQNEYTYRHSEYKFLYFSFKLFGNS